MPIPEKRPLKVFLCHAHANREPVRALYARLKREGVDVWLDKEKLLPGADWEYEIRKAVRESDVVVVCLSKQFNQAGFRQKEVHLALDTAMEKPEGEIFIIPARLEECENLESLRKWHWVELFEDDGYEMLMRALRARADRIGVVLQSRVSSPTPSKLPAQPSASVPEKTSAGAGATGNTPSKSAEKIEMPPPVASLSRDERTTLYNEARAFQVEGKLPEAAALFVKIGDYRDASLRLRKLQLYLAADKCMKQGFADKEDRHEPWQEAYTHLEALVHLDPQFLDVSACLEMTKRWLALPEVYDRLLDALDLDDWKEVLPLFEQIRQVKPTYKRAQTLYNQSITQMAQAGVLGPEMILIPAGEFIMGSDKSNGEKPPHKVSLDSFYIDRYPVTNADYKYFVEVTKHKPPSHWDNGEIPQGKEMHPVVYVGWNDAMAYAQWIGKRLPTEAEWEKAASWDDLKKEKRVYPWGSGFDAGKCNSKESGVGDTTPVGKYSPQGDSFYHVADMVGNVWEWVSSLYKPYPYVFKDGREDLIASGNRVLRGGSWDNLDLYVRSANRYGSLAPGNIYYFVGFRCARSLP
ncbi:MAG: SUMF1/EgtB/PvdO family nonheme iron enzyme [Chloroflexi bacterium]|nr:SUMF1/EgtB/PvdO family nonheme iron enzyme [Chloroflexota bacterium]